MTTPTQFTIVHLFCGAGGGALGMKRAGFRCVGAFDNDPLACESFEKIVGVRPNPIDLSVATPAEIAAACSERPHAVFLSAPCKGMSGCMSNETAATERYQAMNKLTMQGVYLVLEAWPSPPPLIVFENVPRIKTRGRVWLDRIVSMLRNYGYAVTLSSHDCGELGGLAQHRRRFLLVARHVQQCGEYLRVPQTKPLLAIGDVLGKLPQPVAARAPRGTSWPGGRMHVLPALSALNWLRLACITAGSDFHTLPPAVRLTEREARHNGAYGIEGWDVASHSVLGHHDYRATWGSIADPRLESIAHRHDGALGVDGWDGAAHTVTGQHGRRNWDSVADPRLDTERFPASLGVRAWQGQANTIRGTGRIQTEALSIADPRLDYDARRGTYGVQNWDEPSKTVRGNAHIGNDSATSIADPRFGDERVYRGAFGVQGWSSASKTIRGHMNPRIAPSSIADPRAAIPSHAIVTHGGADTLVDGNLALDTSAWPRVEIVGPPIDLDSKRSCYLVIRAADGTWHRPFTTLELAALQGLPVYEDGVGLELAGNAHGVWREQIGNMVPPPAAEAIGRQMIATLTAARDGGMILDSNPIWVRDLDSTPIELHSVASI